MTSLKNFELRLPNLASICVHVLTVFLLLFFGFFHLLFESFWLGVCCLITLLIAIFSLISVVNRTNNEILLQGFVIGAAITLGVASYFHGERGLIYCFPLTASMFFLIRYQTAIFIGAATLVVCSLAALNSMDPFMVARFSLAMSFSLIFLAILAYQLFQQQKQLEREANEDYLTGLMNQRSFYAWLEKLLSSESSLRRKLTLFYFDIDNFKSINDSFGHAGGDLVLKEFSRRIVSAVGEINQEFCLDTEMHFCRLSGDEFVLACVNTTDAEMAADVAKRFHKALADPFLIGGRMTTICSSIGVHHFTIENQSLGEVMQLADAAMYRAKKLGEQQFYISEEDREIYLRETSSAY